MRPTQKRARVTIELIVWPLHAATVTNQRKIVTAVIDFETGDQGPTLEATPYVTDVMNGHFPVTHLR
jgi:hypothetical protein